MAADEAEGELSRSELLARVAELEAELAARDSELADRDARLAMLEGIVAELKEKLDRNSRNSHLPPSSDGPGASGRGSGRKKKGSGRKRGGQKGRRGAHRSLLPPEVVDRLVDLFPPSCERCGAALPERPDPDPVRHQVVELVTGKRRVDEYRRHEGCCEACGHRTRAAYDPTVIPSSPFGPRLVATVAMLTGAYHLSRRSVRQLMRELFGIDIAVGTISNMEARATAALEAAYEEAERAAQDAAVKHSDGTSWLNAGATRSLWVLASVSVTVYKIFANGQRDTIRALFGKLKGILTSDRATVFLFWPMKLRQICWAHLLRKFVSFSERDGPAGVIGRELLDYAALVFEYWQGFHSGQLTRAELIAWMRPLQLQVEVALERAVAADIRRLSGSCKDVLVHRDALWTFVTHEGVEPTNNPAERALRALVLWRRRSFGSQSERGERFVERMMTVVQTLRQRGRDVFVFLVRSVTAHLASTPAPTLSSAA